MGAYRKSVSWEGVRQAVHREKERQKKELLGWVLTNRKSQWSVGHFVTTNSAMHVILKINVICVNFW